MVTERQGQARRFMFIWFAALVAALAGNSPARGADRSISLTEAAEQGAFNVGAATAHVGRSSDLGLGREVLKLDYAMPPGTAAGAWSKAFPLGLNAATTDIVRLRVKAAPSDPLDQVAPALEIKGTAGVQRIPLTVGRDWTSQKETINWPVIGTLQEVVVSVSPTGGGPVAGTIYLDVRFGRVPLHERLGESPLARIVGVLALSLLLGGLPRRGGEPAGRERRGLTRDFVLSVGIVAIACLGIGVNQLGARGASEAGWTALAVALAGAAIGEWLKFGLTGKHLSGREVFQDLFATGLLAASTCPMAILQAPGQWSELLQLSQTVAAVVAIVYHGANAFRLSASGRHLGPVSAAMIVGTPYAFGTLLLLEPNGLLRRLTDDHSAWLEFAARAFVVFSFNEIIANGLSVATKRTLLKSWRAHLSMFLVAIAAVAAPWIAAFGSGDRVGSWSPAFQAVAAVLTTMFSQAGLWAEVYLLTGMVMDAIHGQAPSRGSACDSPLQGLKKAMVFSGTFMGLLHGLALLRDVRELREFAVQHPLVLAVLFGAIVFPLLKTIIETFDGSRAFPRRVGMSYRSPALYLRGGVVGLGLGAAIVFALSERTMGARSLFGFVVGIAAYAGVDALRNGFNKSRERGRLESWRVYFARALLGGFIGAAVGFYLDATQVSVVAAKFERYIAAGARPVPFDVYPLLSKWGYINLGEVHGGVGLLFAEALAGVISWSIPSWLFAINRTLMAAYFRKESAPIRALFTRDGLVQLTQNMIEVLRWGLWMSPIINSFLRPTGEPTYTWSVAAVDYNQDGAVRTLVAIYHDATMGPEAFRAWSLQVFIYLLAYDSVRILIWLDHMGLRVATLVNLSFLGMDKLDERLSRFLAPAATARSIPEGVKRFTTWAPLLIPFYIPRGRDWDDAWNRSQAIIGQEHGGALAALPLTNQLLLGAAGIAGCMAVLTSVRWWKARSGSRGPATWSLSNPEYEVSVRENGELFSRVPDRDFDVSRRSYDFMDPAGRTLFLVETGASPAAWPVIGNFPPALFETSRIEHDEHAFTIVNSGGGLRTTLEITLPGAGDPVELWTVTVENPSTVPRRAQLVPYLEWVLNRPDADRGHTQYNRLFAEMEYARGLNAVLAWDKHAKALGLLASDAAPDGFLTSRMDFIGRARSLWSPRVLETLAFTAAEDTEAHPTFDPIGSLLVSLSLPANGSARVRFLIGLAGDKARAIDLIARHLKPDAASVSAARRRKTYHPIGHGEVPPGTPQPYSEFSEDGRTLYVRTPFTTRPYDHVLSNAPGHVVAVTNRGLHTTSSVNAQQNRLTPDWADTVTREVPAEAFYLFDPKEREWFSPTYHPLNDPEARHEVEFSVEGTAVYRMTRGTLETELTMFVPPDDPAGVYLLTVRNHADAPRRLRLAPYFQMVLAAQPEYSGPLRRSVDRSLNALYFENPRNTYRTGPAFAAVSCPVDRFETNRGRFFGTGGRVARPAFVEHGEPDLGHVRDDRPIAAFLATLEVPARGECVVVVVLGQADDRARAEAVIRKYREPDNARTALEATRTWWRALMDTVKVQTANPEFDRTLDWLKYQGLAERIWARRGFYQASGAFGFRDQLQDSVNLIWMDPAVARAQIRLHASQQFLEGDVVHWFHRLQDGRTGFAARTHASDNLLWLAWGVVEYVGATGDESLLDERTPYLEAEQPFDPLPAGKHGMGFDPLRSSRDDSVYRHCMRAIDLVLEKRMGAHGLPLIGTGDWNDGLDEIGSQGKGESIWLGFFLVYVLDRMAGIVARKDGPERHQYYLKRLRDLKDALERTWRDDRYLRAIHDDGTEIGVKNSGVWEIDALTAAWAVMAGCDPERGKIVFETATGLLEKETTILLGWPPLREDTKPYLGRSSAYPEGVRENGMYCHGVQWLVGAARLLAEHATREGKPDEARCYRETAERLWLKVSPIPHVVPGEIETYGGQPNKQAADMVTTFNPGRMIWHGYTGAAGWMFRQALEGVLGMRLVNGAMVPPADVSAQAEFSVVRDVNGSPLLSPRAPRPPASEFATVQTTRLT